MKKLFLAFVLILATLAGAQTQRPNVVFGPVSIAGPIIFTNSTQLQVLPYAAYNTGNFIATYSGVTGSPSGCSLQIFFGGATMTAIATAIASATPNFLPGTPVNGVVSARYFPVASTGAKFGTGPLVTAAITWTCVTYPTAGTAYFEVIPDFFPQFPSFSYFHISSNACNIISTATAAFLHNVTVNAAGSGETITIYDNTACSGTVLATITPAAGATYFYDANTTTGLAVLTAGTTAGDYTIDFR